MIRPGRTYALLLRQVYLLKGSPARIIPLFAWSAIDIVLWGFITRWLDAATASRLDFVPMLLGAVLLWDFFGRVMQGVTTAFFEDVWSRNFLNVFSTPLTVAEYVAGLVLASVVTSAIGLAVMVALAVGAFGLSLPLGAMLGGFLLILFLFGIALGIVGCAIVLRLGPAAEWLIWPIPAVLSPFVGVFYPLSVLPGWMQAVGHALPPTRVFESMRGMVAGGAGSWADVGWGLALAVVELVIAAWIFTRVHRHAIRTGLIARYSAETVS